MSTSETLAMWALIVSGATLLVYLGQLVVLVLVYRRVIRETDRNAEQRKAEIEKAGDMMRTQGKTIERSLLQTNKRNTVVLAVMTIGLTVMLFANRAIVHKIEKKSTKE